MTETNTETGARIISHTVTNTHQNGAEHAAGDGARPLLPRRNHHCGSNPRRRAPMSQEQRQKLSVAQKAYVAHDPRWAEHRRKLADTQIARRMTLLPDEVSIPRQSRGL